MPPRTDESPPGQQDRAAEVSRDPRNEVRNSEPERPREDEHYDIGEWMDYPDINTHGSER